MPIMQLSVFAQNKPGAIIEITHILAEAGVNIRALSLADTADFGILRLIVNPTDKAEKVLEDAGYLCQLSPVIAVAMPDKPGGLSHVLSVLSENGINIEYMYAFVSRRSDDAYMILRPQNCEEAEEALKNAGEKVLSSNDVEALH